MADTTFVNGTTLTDADWFNDVNRLHYTILGDPADVAAVKDTLHSAPGAIGDVTPAAGAFTTLTATGGALVIGAAPLGYGTGAGGTVTQATSKSTAVTLNKPTGQITMNSAALAASGSAQFIFNNSLLSGTDILLLTVNRAGIASSTNYNVWGDVGAGSSFVTLRNISAGSLSEAVIINFAIIKGATS